MSDKIHNEIVIATSLIIILFLFLNPFNLWMPDMLVYTMIVVLVVLFSLFSSFIWKEKPLDEREQLHKLMANRAGYLAGVASLVLAIVVESIISHVDPWIVIVLGLMILAKVFGHIYSKRKS